MAFFAVWTLVTILVAMAVGSNLLKWPSEWLHGFLTWLGVFLLGAAMAKLSIDAFSAPWTWNNEQVDFTVVSGCALFVAGVFSLGRMQ